MYFSIFMPTLFIASGVAIIFFAAKPAKHIVNYAIFTKREKFADRQSYEST